MNRRPLALTIALLGIGIQAGCENIDPNLAIGSAVDAYSAYQLDDAQVIELSARARESMDRENTLASASSPYTKRLMKIVGPHKNAGGLDLDFRVYVTPDINAFAMADGTVRVYTGLMDLMSDDELLFVLGHEIGHVELGHSKNKMRVAYGAAAARKGLAATGGTIGELATSDIGGITEQAVNSQFSQRDELAADAFSLRFMHKYGYPEESALSALAKLGGGSSNFLATHPDSAKRQQKIRDQIAHDEGTR